MNKDDIKLPPIPEWAVHQKVDNAVKEYAIDAIKADRKQHDNEWKQAVDHELTTMLSTADSYDIPAEAVSALINWHVTVATDPAVSRQAHISTAPKFGEEKMNQLFCDLKTDEEKSNFFLSGRGYVTGVIAQSIQNDVAMAYRRCAEYEKEVQSLRKDAERFNKIINMTRAERKESLFFDCDKDVIKAVDNIYENR